MYRMILVEDEQIEREGFRDLYDWAGLDIEIAGACETAEEALAALRGGQAADILFTDISLPGMDGLELARQACALLPDLRVIICSGYREFEFARQAIEISAYGYLPKPLEQDELARVVRRTMASIRTQRDEREKLRRLLEESLPLLRRHFLATLLNGPMDDGLLAEKLEFFGLARHRDQAFVAAVLDIDRAEGREGRTSEELYTASLGIMEIIGRTPEDMVVLAAQLNETRFCLLMHAEAPQGRSHHLRLTEHLQGLQERIHRAYGVTATIGVGSRPWPLGKVAQSYQEACQALELRFFLPPDHILEHRDIGALSGRSSDRDMNEFVSRVVSGVELCDAEQTGAALEALFAELRQEQRYGEAYSRSVCIQTLARVSLTLMEMNESIERIIGRETPVWTKLSRAKTLLELQNHMREAMGAILDAIKSRKASHVRRTIDGIIRYIERHYAENITINDISEEVYLSSNYISTIFRKETGVTFSDFLIQYRLEKARELLLNTAMKVYQVGNKVGYSNISYFCNIFKSFYGVSPNEYRERH